MNAIKCKPNLEAITTALTSLNIDDEGAKNFAEDILQTAPKGLVELTVTDEDVSAKYITSDTKLISEFCLMNKVNRSVEISNEGSDAVVNLSMKTKEEKPKGIDPTKMIDDEKAKQAASKPPTTDDGTSDKDSSDELATNLMWMAAGVAVGVAGYHFFGK